MCCPESVTINTGYWERGRWYENDFQGRLDYLFTYLIQLPDETYQTHLDRLLDFLRANGAKDIKLPPQDLKKYPYDRGYDGYVQNDDGCIEEDILTWFNNDEELWAYLFGNHSYVHIGDEDYGD